VTEAAGNCRQKDFCLGDACAWYLWGGAPRASVIFVHGLGGHARMENRAVPQENINVFE
jgi:hypothetical protein